MPGPEKEVNPLRGEAQAAGKRGTLPHQGIERMEVVARGDSSTLYIAIAVRALQRHPHTTCRQEGAQPCILEAMHSIKFLVGFAGVRGIK